MSRNNNIMSVRIAIHALTLSIWQVIRSAERHTAALNSAGPVSRDKKFQLQLIIAQPGTRRVSGAVSPDPGGVEQNTARRISRKQAGLGW